MNSSLRLYLYHVISILFLHNVAFYIYASGAWVISGGSNTGVMKHVGEAVKSSSCDKRVAIGIATWGCISNRDQLLDAKVSKKYINKQ